MFQPAKKKADMEDASQSAKTPAVSATPVPQGVRVRFLIGLIVVVGGIAYGIQRYGYDAFAMGWDVRFMATSALVGVGLMIAFFMGGFSWRGRIVFLLLMGLGWGVLKLLVRKVNVDGAMIPSDIEWVWEPPRAPKFDPSSISGDPSALLGSWSPTPSDCPEFRGVKRDGVIPGPAIARDWKTTPPKLVWGPVPVGIGYGSMAVAGGHLVALEQRLDREAIVCYRRDTGKEIWVHSYPALFQRSEMQGGDGPCGTPTVVGDNIYSLGSTGVLVRLDGKGKPVWSVNVIEDVKADNLQWGMSGSPLVVDDLVIVNPGVGKQPGAIGGVVAYDVETGKRRWTSSDPKPAGYSSPQLSEVGGAKQVLIFDGHGLAGLDPKTGKQFWREPWRTNQGINVCQPTLVGDDRIYISSGYMVGGGLFKVAPAKEQWMVERLWKDTRSMQCKFSSPVHYEGRLYGISDVDLVCIDVKTGKRLWKGPSVGYGQILLRGDLLIVLTERGEVLMAAATPAKYEELGKFNVFGEKTWNTPTLAGDHLFLRNQWRMVCFRLPTQDPSLAMKP